MNLQPTYDHTKLTASAFHFLADTFKFGADENLTVITAYLTLNATITDVVKQRRPDELTAEPTALIVAYDVEDALLSLLCVDAEHTQYAISLSATEMAALYSALRNFVQSHYQGTPEQVLNWTRKSACLAPLR